MPGAQLKRAERAIAAIREQGERPPETTKALDEIVAAIRTVEGRCRTRRAGAACSLRHRWIYQIGDANAGPHRMKKPAKTAAEIEAIIRVEMEEISDWPTDIAVSVRPDGDSWKVVIAHGSEVDSDRFEMILLICDRLRTEFDLKN